MISALLALFLTAAGIQNSGPAGFEGTIFDEITGKPIASAQILRRATIPPNAVPGQLVNANTVIGETDSEGHFRLGNLEAGSLALTFAKAGYRSTGGTYTLVAGQSTPVQIRLLPFGTVSGRVLDSRGTPAAGVRVTSLRYQTTSEGRRQLVETSGTTTNDRGEFRLFDLLPDRYFISFSLSASASQTQLPQTRVFESPDASGRSQSLYPGVQVLERATVVEARGGEETTIKDTVLTSDRYGTIQVRVMNPAGEATREIQFGFTLTTPRISPSATGITISTSLAMVTGSRLRIESGSETQVEYWPTQPGTYELVVGSRNDRGEAETFTSVTEFDGASTAINVVMMKPEGKLTARVLQEKPDGTTTPLQDVNLSFGTFSTSRVAYFVTSMPSGLPVTPSLRGRAGYIPTMTTGAEGTTTAWNLPHGQYDFRGLTLTSGPLPQELYVSSARQGARDVLSDGAIVSTEEGIVEIRLRTGASRLTGVVRNNQAQTLASAIVAILPEGPRSNWTLSQVRKATATRPDGSFELTGIPPGSYTVYAWSKLEANAQHNAEFMKTYRDRGRPLQIEENGKVSMDLTALDLPPEK